MISIFCIDIVIVDSDWRYKSSILYFVSYDNDTFRAFYAQLMFKYLNFNKHSYIIIIDNNHKVMLYIFLNFAFLQVIYFIIIINK